MIRVRARAQTEYRESETLAWGGDSSIFFKKKIWALESRKKVCNHDSHHLYILKREKKVKNAHKKPKQAKIHGKMHPNCICHARVEQCSQKKLIPPPIDLFPCKGLYTYFIVLFICKIRENVQDAGEENFVKMQRSEWNRSLTKERLRR